MVAEISDSLSIVVLMSRMAPTDSPVVDWILAICCPISPVALAVCSASAFPSDYVMQVTMRRFEADYTGGGAAPEVHVVFDCMVGKREGREVVASFLAEGAAQASANRLAAVVAAFETATNTALDSMSMQAAEAVHASMGRKKP